MKMLSGVNGMATVKVMDMQGRVVKTTNINSNETISLGSELKSGTYFVEVRQGNQVKITRVMKF